MSFDWKQLLSLAGHLLDNSGNLPGGEEGIYRTVINRAYYAALNTAAVYIRDVVGDDVPDDSKYHPQVKMHFKNDRAKFELLETLRKKRDKADYSLESGKFRDMARAAVEESRKFIESPEFKNLFADSGK